MPELAIRHFVTVDDAGRGKYVCAELGVRDCGSDARSFGILNTAFVSETPFGYVIAIDDDFHA